MVSEPSVLGHPSAHFIIFAVQGMLNIRKRDLMTQEEAVCKQTGAATSPMRFCEKSSDGQLIRSELVYLLKRRLGVALFLTESGVLMTLQREVFE